MQHTSEMCVFILTIYEKFHRCIILYPNELSWQYFLLFISRLLVKFPELNYQLKIKVCIDKWVLIYLGILPFVLILYQKDTDFDSTPLENLLLYLF